MTPSKENDRGLTSNGLLRESARRQTTLPFEAADVTQKLLRWYVKQGRDLPWRKTRDPYRIWVSEIMLQQTTVNAVIPYYQRFLKRFPTVDGLAAASFDDVVQLWAGLGYYSRARNLHRAAQKIMAELKGEFPRTTEDWVQLPGIGRSTAGAIVSIAYDQPAPILDGNVRRVLVRLFAWAEDPRSSRAERQLWAWAEALTPESQPHDYAQAIMDLGATVCTPRQTDCEQCPLKDHCLAYAKGLVNDLPVPRKKKAIPVRCQVSILVWVDRALLMHRRPNDGFLGGLWEFPSAELMGEFKTEQTVKKLIAQFNLGGQPEKIGDIRHAYSHFKLELEAFFVRGDSRIDVDEHNCHWIPFEELKTLPLHGAHQKVFQRFCANLGSYIA